jgi:Ca-activated chloride channel family protein
VTFESPLALVGLVVVPLLIGLYAYRERKRNEYATRFTSVGLLPNLVAAAPGWRRHLPLALLLAGLTAMVVGVARPHASLSVKREEATVIVAIDSSLSMRAQDVPSSRLATAQKTARAFVDELPKKFRVAVLGFSGRPYVAVPPTEDRDLVHNALNSLRTGEGTSLGDAIALGIKLAKQERASDGTIPPTAMLVISDGAQKTGRLSPAAAALQAAAAHIPIYSVVVGTPDGVINVPLAGGYQAQLRVPVDPETLQLVARVSGGRTFTSPNNTQLQVVYKNLGSRLGSRKENREITNLFAGGSAAFLLFGGALSAFWFRRVP